MPRACLSVFLMSLIVRRRSAFVLNQVRHTSSTVRTAWGEASPEEKKLRMRDREPQPVERPPPPSPAFSRRGGGGSSYNSRSRGVPSRRQDSSRQQQEQQSWTRREPLPCHWDQYPEDSDFVYGKDPVMAALRSNRRTIHALYYEGNALTQELSDLCNSLGVAAEEMPKGRLQSKIDQPKPVHQGLTLCCSALQQECLNAAFDAPLWLALDQVQDPRNLGAIARSARFFDVPLLTCAKNSAPLSPVASKASAGAIEEMEVYEARNLMNFLRNSKPHFRVVGAALSGGDKRKDREVIALKDFKIKQPTILVLGSEGAGLRTNIVDACDDLIKVKGRIDAANTQLDSLNVAVTAALLLHHLDLQIERLQGN